MHFHTILGSPPQSLIPDISISACFEQDINNRNEEKTEEKERKQRPEERRGGEQQESLSSELQGPGSAPQPSSPTRPPPEAACFREECSEAGVNSLPRSRK